MSDTVEVWVNSDEQLYREVQALADESNSSSDLAESIEELVREYIGYNNMDPFAKDLIDSALADTDFRSIASSHFDEAQERRE